MAVLAVYILLALVGTGVCDDLRDVPAPPPTQAPAATPAPAAAASAGSVATSTTTTQAPPTPGPSRHRQEASPSKLVQKLMAKMKTKQAPLYNYALQNAARMQGRSIVHCRRNPCGDEDEVEFCACDGKLYDEAARYREFDAVERWCVYYPEERRAMGVEDDDDDDDDDDEDEESSLRPQNVVSVTASAPADRMSDTVEMQTEPASSSTTESSVKLEIHETDVQPGPSSSASCDPESYLSASRALDNLNAPYIVSQPVQAKLTMLPSILPFSTSGNRPEASGSENEQNEEKVYRIISKQKVPLPPWLEETLPSELTIDFGSLIFSIDPAMAERDPPMEVDGGAERMDVDVEPGDVDVEPGDADAEPQPGPSGVCRPPVRRRRNFAFPLSSEAPHFPYPEPVIVRAGAESEDVEPLDLSLPKEDLNAELDRIMGVRRDGEEYCVKQPDVKYCFGELIVTMLGTPAWPIYSVNVKCDRESDICPPPTVCSAVVDPFTVTKRKHVPFEPYVFRLVGEQPNRLTPAKLKLPTACFCAPPDHTPRRINAYLIPAST